MRRQHTGTAHRARLFAISSRVFVGPKVPFVGNEIPPVKPFIGYNAPFVRIGGFSLVEMIVTVAVVAILLSVGYPTMQTFFKNQRLITQINDLITDLTYARSEAVRRSTTISVCASANGTTCGGTWQSGRLTFVDVNANGAVDAPTDVVLRYRELLEGSTTLRNSLGGLFITFAGNGTRFTGGGGLGNTIEFNLCDDRLEAMGRQLTVNSLGQARTVQVSPLPPGSC